MSNTALREAFLSELERKFGRIAKLDGSQSLYEVGDGQARVYLRYSRLHGARRTFYGLRKEDLEHLDERHGFICFLWDGQVEPLILPYADYADVFRETAPARDHQYKTQVLLGEEGVELYVARAGRFSVDADIGWAALEDATTRASTDVPALTHLQVQAILGSIGALKQFDVWIPPKDRGSLDWSVATPFRCVQSLPCDDATQALLHEIDAVWIHRGSSRLAALYEVEHSTPVYSGLLRLNDVHLTVPAVDRLAIVSNEVRKSLFVRQLRRPTFKRSGLSDSCTFLDYTKVFEWYKRVLATEPT